MDGVENQQVHLADGKITGVGVRGVRGVRVSIPCRTGFSDKGCVMHCSTNIWVPSRYMLEKHPLSSIGIVLRTEFLKKRYKSRLQKAQVFSDAG